MSQQPATSGEAFPHDGRSFWWRRLCTQNPFYLISAACFIHSLKFATGGEAGPLSLYPRLILIGIYLLVVVVTALILVRRYKLWDDARSLLLIVLLLFCELNLGIDELLATRFTLGVMGELGVLAIILVTSEILFRSLPLRFPGIYRVPYYLLWNAITLWPIVCQAAAATHDVSATRWVIAAFSPLCASLLLTLIPAARTGRAGIEPSGTPWPWPLHPWTVFFFLILAVVFRLNAMCVSFDSAADFGPAQAYALWNIFAPWLLIPLLFAIAELVLERALVKQAAVGQTLASLLALVWIPLGLSAGSGNAVSLTFVKDVTQTIGSPAWLALLACLGIQALALIRGSRPAYVGLMATLVIGSSLSPATIAFEHLGDFDSRWLWTAAALALAPGLWRWRLDLSLVTGILAITALRIDDVITSELLPESLSAIPRWFIDGHLMLGWILCLASLTREDASQILCGLAGLLLFPLLLSAITSGFPPLWIVAYVVSMAVTIGLFAWWSRSDVLRGLAMLMGLYVAIRGGWLGYMWATDELDWAGVHWLAAALVLFAVGLATSLAKTRGFALASKSPDTG